METTFDLTIVTALSVVLYLNSYSIRKFRATDISINQIVLCDRDVVALSATITVIVWGNSQELGPHIKRSCVGNNYLRI